MTEIIAIEVSCMVNWEEVVSPCRREELVDARTFYTVFWREKGKPYMQIAKELSRSHASIISLLKRHKMMMNYIYYREKYNKFRRLTDDIQYVKPIRNRSHE